MPSRSTTSAPKAETKKNPLLEARNAATRRLIEEYKPRHDELYSQEAEKRGVVYTPEPTPDQKREAEFRRLLAEDPTLAERVLAAQDVAVVEGDDGFRAE